ncbi:MAG: hypothetical protein ACRDSS_14795, partial [Actinocrinis sp.]
MDTAQSTPEARTRVKLPPDPYQDGGQPRPPRGRRPLVLAGALVLLVAVITIVNRGTHHGSSPQADGQPSASGSNNGSSASNGSTGSTAPVTVPQGAGLPSNSADGVPIGYPHTKQGAESAAANYVVAYSSSQMVNSSARHQLIDAIADPAISSALQSQLDTA